MQELSIPDKISCRKEYKVKPEHAAKHVGSGEVEVLSTPSMIAFMEAASLECVQQYLPDNLTTVGTMVNVRHLKPAPVGATIVVETQLVKKEGKRLLFDVKAYWKQVLIGEGKHERYVVDKEKFLEKLRKLIDEIEG